MIAIHVFFFQCMAHTCATHTDAPTWTHFTHICLPAMTASVNWKWPPNAQRRQAAKFTTTAGPPPHCTSPPLLSLSFWTGNINKATFRRLTVFQFPLHDASHCWPRAMRWVAMPSRWRCRCRYIWMRYKRGRSGIATHRSPRMRSVSTSGHPPC